MISDVWTFHRSTRICSHAATDTLTRMHTLTRTYTHLHAYTHTCAHSQMHTTFVSPLSCCNATRKIQVIQIAYICTVWDISNEHNIGNVRDDVQKERNENSVGNVWYEGNKHIGTTHVRQRQRTLVWDKGNEPLCETKATNPCVRQRQRTLVWDKGNEPLCETKATNPCVRQRQRTLVWDKGNEPLCETKATNPCVRQRQRTLVWDKGNEPLCETKATNPCVRQRQRTRNCLTCVGLSSGGDVSIQLVYWSLAERLCRASELAW